MLAALISAVLATVVATTVTFISGTSSNPWVRRLFLVVINLNPFTSGTWRNEFSKRETFLACWFLVFIATLAVLLNTRWVGLR